MPHCGAHCCSPICYALTLTRGSECNPGLVKRREFITLLGGAAAAWPFAARAQQPGKLPSVGILGPDPPAFQNPLNTAFARQLSELGWVEGRTVTITAHFAEGRAERFSEIAAELVRLKVDVIVTASTRGVLAAKRATSGIPIVFAGAGDPVGARPGRRSFAARRQRHRALDPTRRSRWQAP